MKILLLHADFVEWEPKKKAIPMAEDVEKKPRRVEEALVVFTAVESGDEAGREQVVKNSVKEILGVFGQVKARTVVLYPYAHLSSDLAQPSLALRVLKEMEKELKERKIPVERAPFGWYKAFDLKCKGHPLSELSKTISAEGGKISAEEGGKADKEMPKALAQEKKLKSEWFIMEPSGKMHRIEMGEGKARGFDFSGHPKLQKLVSYEMAKSRVVDKEPPHIKLMRRLELVDYEPGSDPGNFRYFPKGKLVKGLLEDWVTKKTLEYGAMEVETPIMYDYEHPSLKNYLNRFPARQYTIQTPNKKVFLRFSACFGQFLMAHDATISYRHLPLRMYELTKYSFRVEQRGELAGLRRLRTFTMPDCHALCRDVEQAKEEMLRRFRLSKEVNEGFGLTIGNDFEFAIRVVKDFFEKNRDFVAGLVEEWGKPALIEVWDQKFFYFVMKHEWNFIDALDKAACLTTDQIDVENAERYGIQFTDSDNTRKYPVILHLSPSGAIERVLYALLEKTEMDGKKNPVLPLWLSPTQVRLCPVSDKFVKHAEKIVDSLSAQCIRADLDDRVESVGKKIRDAEVEWVPYIVVVGEKEMESGKLAVRIRESGKVESLTEKELASIVKKQTEGFPYRPLPLPRLLTKRPVFVG